MPGAQCVFSFRNLSTAANRWLWMFCILALAGCGKVELYSGLPEAEANRMTAILDQNGIAGSKTAGAENTFTVMVDREDFARAVDLMHNNGFPRGQFTNIGEVFKKSGMVSSPTEDRIRFMYALSQSLSETISQIDGVVTARVHIVLPEEKPLTETYFPASAAVFVKVQPESRVSDLRSEIKQLVANSIEGMQVRQCFTGACPGGRNGPFQNDSRQEECYCSVDGLGWICSLGGSFAGGVCRPVPSKADQQSGERSKSAADG